MAAPLLPVLVLALLLWLLRAPLFCLSCPQTRPHIRTPLSKNERRLALLHKRWRQKAVIREMLWLLAALMLTVVEGADPGGSVSPVDDATLKSLEGRILNQIETSGHQGQHSGRMDLQSLESKIMNQIKAPVVRKRTTPNRVSALGSSSEGELDAPSSMQISHV